MTTPKSSRETRWLIGLMILSIALHLYFSWISLHNLPETSDEASAALLAQDIANGARPLLFTGQPYQFPIEDYLVAPFSGLLPHNSLGARGPGLLLGFLSFIVFLATAWKVFEPGNRWPALLMILFPSAYWLMHTSAYTPPQYASSSLLAALLFYLAIKCIKDPHPPASLVVFSGIVGGLALSNHLLLISVVVGVYAVMAFRGNWRNSVRAALLFSVGLFVGLVPYLLALIQIPGAYENISDTRPLQGALKILFSNVETSALFGAFGLNPPLFIDLQSHLRYPSSLERLLTMLYLVFLGAILLSRSIKFLRQILNRDFPEFQWPDMFLATSLVTLFLFAASTHSAPIDHRYLLPAVWSFPFLAGYVFTLARYRWRGIVAIFVVAATGYNLWISADLIKVWRDKAALQLAADTRDLSPVLEWLKSNNYDRCYASFWTAYRVTYETDRKIICSLIYNERYFHWPIPFKQIVDNSSRVAAIITDTHTSHIHTSDYEALLNILKVEYKRTPVEKFAIYHDFSIPADRKQILVSPNEYLLGTNARNSDVSPLEDNDTKTTWDSLQDQNYSLQLHAQFKHDVFLNSVSLYYDYSNFSPAHELLTEVKTQGQWQTVSRDKYGVDALRFLNGHPVIGKFQQIIRFDPVTASAVRVKIATPVRNAPWKIAEIKFYEAPH